MTEGYYSSITLSTSSQLESTEFFSFPIEPKRFVLYDTLFAVDNNSEDQARCGELGIDVPWSTCTIHSFMG